MLVRVGKAFIAALVCAGLVPTARGEPAPEKAELVRTDATGDPLPPGAVARLGTERLFHPEADFLLFSPDDKFLVSAGGSRSCVLWEVATGKELRRFDLPAVRGGRVTVCSIAMSADGKLLALGSEDKVVRVWETATGKERSTFAELPCSMFCLAFDPRGHFLAGGGAGASVQVWDLDANKPVGPWGECKSIRSLAYAADGKTLTALEYDPNRKTLVLSAWETTAGKQRWRRECEQYSNGVLLPGGGAFAEPDSDEKAIRLRDPESGRELGATAAVDSRLWMAAAAADRVLTVSGKGNDRTVRIHAAVTGKGLAEFQSPTGSVWRAALSHDGKLVALTDRTGGTIQVWDVGRGKPVHAFAGHPNGPVTVAFAADGKSVFTTTSRNNRTQPPAQWADWSLRQWDPLTGKELRVTRKDLGTEVHWCCFSADGGVLAVVTAEGKLRLWDTAADKELRSWNVPTLVYTINGQPLAGQALWHPAFALDGKSLVAAGDKKVYRWDTRTGTELASVALENTLGFTRCLPGADGRTVLVMDWTGSVVARTTLLDTAKKREVVPLGEVRSPFPACAFSPDGHTVAVADEGRTTKTFGVALWEVASGQDRGRFDNPKPVSALAFSPDGTLLAVGGGTTLRLFLAVGGQEVAAVETDLRSIASLAFSPDGKLLAAAGWGATALVYDVAALTDGKLPKAGKRTATELDALSVDLCGADGAKAYRAVALLAAAPTESLPLLKERLKERGDANAKQLAQLVADLDDNSFEVREKASAELAKLGIKAEAVLTRALEKTESAEVRARVRRLLAKLNDTTLPSEELIRLRALEAIANMGTPEARELLKELANGDADDRLTLEAKAALKRLERR